VLSATRRIGENAGRGIAVVVSEEAPEIVDEFASSEHSHRLMAALAATAARAVAEEMSTSMDGKLGPAAARAIRQDIGPAITETFDGRLDPALARSAGAIVHQVVRVMSAGIEQDLGPAAARTIRQDIGPAISESIDQNIDEALARGARVASRESVLGTHDGLLELREQPDSILGGVLRFGANAVQLLILATGIVLGALIALLVQSKRSERRERARAEEREATLLAIYQALRRDPA
jgi:hypothetical protein